MQIMHLPHSSSDGETSRFTSDVSTSSRTFVPFLFKREELVNPIIHWRWLVTDAPELFQFLLRVARYMVSTSQPTRPNPWASHDTIAQVYSPYPRQLKQFIFPSTPSYYPLELVMRTYLGYFQGVTQRWTSNLPRGIDPLTKSVCVLLLYYMHSSHSSKSEFLPRTVSPYIPITFVGAVPTTVHAACILSWDWHALSSKKILWVRYHEDDEWVGFIHHVVCVGSILCLRS